MDNSDFDIHWYNRLQFRVLAIFMAMFLLIMMTIIILANTLGEKLIERQAYLKLSEAGISAIKLLPKVLRQKNSSSYCYKKGVYITKAIILVTR